MAKLEKFYRFMDKSPFNRRIVGTLIGILLIGGFYIIGTGVTHTIQDSIARSERAKEIQRVKDADPKEWVNFYSVNVDNAPIGDLPNITLCRKLGHGTVKIDAVRTFIRYEDGQQKQVLERGFKAAIENSITNTDCTTVDLQGQPQVVGTYSIFTDYCFNVEVYGETVKKCDNYSSNKYEMTDDLKQLKERLDSLQQEYDRRLSNQSEAQSSSTITQSAPSSGNQSTASNQPSGSSGSNAGGSSSGGSTGGGSSSGGNSGNQNGGGITLDLPLLPPIKLFGE